MTDLAVNILETLETLRTHDGDGDEGLLRFVVFFRVVVFRRLEILTYGKQPIQNGSNKSKQSLARYFRCR